jgi:GAF domain-containing protein/anti-sigma regulatory factor (Ser/Thr protein kinase)
MTGTFDPAICAAADAMTHIVWISEPDGSREWFNAAWYAYTGLTREQALPKFGTAWTGVVHADDAPAVFTAWRTALEHGRTYGIEARLRGAGGTYRRFRLRAVPLHGDDGIVRWLGSGSDVEDHRRVEAQRAEIAQLQDRLQFGARAGDVLTESLSVDATLQRLVDLVVPGLADWAGIDLIDDHGRLRATAIVHADPARAELVERMRGAYAARPEVEPLIIEALQKRRAHINRTIDPDVIARVAPPELLPILTELAPHSSMTVPLRSQNRTLGSLVAYWSESDRTYSEDDVPLFEDLARRAAIAIENAQLYEREHEVASAFQRAALPVSLPDVPGVAFDAVYVPARNDAQVGGDWYDALRLSDGRVVISIGDVAGSGLEAAVIMAAMRQIVRGVAHVYPDPATMLDAADRTLKVEHPDRMVTAFVAVYDPIGGKLTYANAGHPPPLVRRADGGVEALPGRGLPLGLRDRTDVDGGVVPIADGSLLLFYSDGLTESTRDPVEGEHRLREILAREAVVDDDRTARRIYDEMLRDGTHDDVVILTMHLGGDNAVRRRWTFDTADAASARDARLSFVDTLRAAGVATNDVFASELIFGELLGNVARHAPGPIAIALEWDDGSAPVLHVLDDGPGFVVVPRLPSDMLSERGRGLFLVWSLAEEFNVTRRESTGSHARAVLPASRGR